MSARPRLLDLFCGAGGAAVGYERAGFDVVGVDIAPQPHYPFKFVQGDALEYLDGDSWARSIPYAFDAVHASPPCQDHSSLASITGGNGTGWMLDATLRGLSALRIPWVCENVVGAPLANGDTLFGQHGVELCGTMFGLQVLRHRLFETSFSISGPAHGSHDGKFFSPAGHGHPNWRERGSDPLFHGAGYARRCAEAMGIDWMNRDELAQAIPPTYTEFIGARLLDAMSLALSGEVVE